MGKPSVQRFGEDVRKLFEENRMVVFLCGPSLNPEETKPSAELRKRLKEGLEAANFEVVLGEDDGLEDVRLKVSGGLAHENELAFIHNECGAIVVVADSPGSFCELGLFAHWVTHNSERKCDLILLADVQYEHRRSYLNEGPAIAAELFGKRLYVDFANADIGPVISRLKSLRSIHISAGRGRPAGGV